jgi:hypothetical protein
MSRNKAKRPVDGLRIHKHKHTLSEVAAPLSQMHLLLNRIDEIETACCLRVVEGSFHCRIASGGTHADDARVIALDLVDHLKARKDHANSKDAVGGRRRAQVSCRNVAVYAYICLG